MQSARAERATKRARRESDAQFSRKVSTEVPRPLRKRPAMEALPTPGALRPRSRPFVSAAKRARRQQRNTGAGVVRERRGSGNPRSQDPPQGSQGSSRSNHAAPPRSGAGNPRSRHRAPPPQGDGSGGECMPSAHGTPPPADAVSPRSRGSSQDLQGSPRNRRAGCEFTIDDARSRDHGCQSPGNTISRRQGTNRAGGRRRERAARRYPAPPRCPAVALSVARAVAALPILKSLGGSTRTVWQQRLLHFPYDKTIKCGS